MTKLWNRIRAALGVLGWASVVVLAVGLLTVVVLAFGPLPARVLGGTAEALQPNERVKAEADARSAVLQAVAGVLLVIGAITAWRQMLVSRSQHRVSRHAATTEAFAKGVELLGDEAVALRIGGVYALDRVAMQEPEEAARVAEILVAHVRESSALDGQERTQDMSAAVSILVARKWPVVIDFAGLDLRQHRFTGAIMRGARLTEARLYGVSLHDADLREADLRKADLRGADLAGADLRGADLGGAMFSGARSTSATRWPPNFVPEDHGIRDG